jgi:hypothetical protein
MKDAVLRDMFRIDPIGNIFMGDPCIQYCPWCSTKIELEEEKPKVKKRYYAKVREFDTNPDDGFFLFFKGTSGYSYNKRTPGEEHDIKLEPETNRLYIETDSE